MSEAVASSPSPSDVMAAKIFDCIEQLRDVSASGTSSDRRLIQSKLTRLVHVLGPVVPSPRVHDPNDLIGRKHIGKRNITSVEELPALPGKARIQNLADPAVRLKEHGEVSLVVHKSQKKHVPAAPVIIPRPRFVRNAVKTYHDKQTKSVLKGGAFTEKIREFQSVFDPTNVVVRMNSAHIEVKQHAKKRIVPVLPGTALAPQQFSSSDSYNDLVGKRMRFADLTGTLDAMVPRPPQAAAVARKAVGPSKPLLEKPIGSTRGRSNFNSTSHNAVMLGGL
eukprot:PhM_4_TR11048/c0_g1_i1/m.87599